MKDYALVVKVGNEEDLKLLAPKSEYKPREEDDIRRIVIPAFPPTRRTMSHFHTNAVIYFIVTRYL